MFTIWIANHKFTIANKYPYVKNLCKDYQCDETETEEYISVSDAEIQMEQTEKYSEAYLESLAIQRKLTETLIQHDILLLHGSVVAVDGKAYLFTALSGTGKSTHTKLWMDLFGSRAIMVNDDKPFLHISDKQVIVYGTPWNGKHNRGNNIAVPLKAICILERGTENEIEPLRKKDCWKYLLQQSYHSENIDNMTKTLSLLDRLQNLVEMFHLKCNMEIDAAQKAYDGMNRK